MDRGVRGAAGGSAPGASVAVRPPRPPRPPPRPRRPRAPVCVGHGRSSGHGGRRAPGSRPGPRRAVSRVAACGWRTTMTVATRLGSPGHGGAAEGSGCLGVDYRGCHIDSQPGRSSGFLLPAWEILPPPWSFLKAVIWPARLSGPGRLGTPF